MPRPLPPCPDCAADSALILRAVYRHYPSAPLRWLALLFPTHLTLVYSCAACHHRVLINTTCPRSLLSPAPPRTSHRRRRHGHANDAQSWVPAGDLDLD
jgi:hypothetical protein